MKRYKNRFASLLRLKKQAKRLAEFDQYTKKNKLDSALLRLRELEEDLSTATSEVSRRLGNAVPANQYLLQQDMIQKLQQQIATVNQRISEMERAFRDACETRATLASEVEALITLRTAEQKEHLKSLRNANQQQLDDDAMRGWSSGPTSSREVNTDG